MFLHIILSIILLGMLKMETGGSFHIHVLNLCLRIFKTLSSTLTGVEGCQCFFEIGVQTIEGSTDQMNESTDFNAT